MILSYFKRRKGVKLLLLFTTVFCFMVSGTVHAETETKLVKVLSNNFPPNTSIHKTVQLNDKTVFVFSSFDGKLNAYRFGANGEFSEITTGNGQSLVGGYGTPVGTNKYANVTKDQLYIFSNKGDILKQCNVTGGGSKGIGVLSNGNIYITDNSTSSVTIYTDNCETVKTVNNGAWIDSVSAGKDKFIIMSNKNKYKMFKNDGTLEKTGDLETSGVYGQPVSVKGLDDGRWVTSFVYNVNNDSRFYRLYDSNLDKITKEDHKVRYLYDGHKLTNGNYITNVYYSVFETSKKIYNIVNSEGDTTNTLQQQLEKPMYLGNLSNGRFALYAEEKVQIYQNDGSLLVEDAVDGNILYELGNGNLMFINGYRYTIYKYSGDSGGGGGNGDVDNSKNISFGIFIPMGATAPKGFKNVGGDVWEKEDSGYKITIYVIRYTPPATIGNLNIQ